MLSFCSNGNRRLAPNSGCNADNSIMRISTAGGILIAVFLWVVVFAICFVTFIRSRFRKFCSNSF
jgi:hypothetical protein